VRGRFRATCPRPIPVPRRNGMHTKPRRIGMADQGCDSFDSARQPSTCGIFPRIEPAWFFQIPRVRPRAEQTRATRSATQRGLECGSAVFKCHAYIDAPSEAGCKRLWRATD